MKLNDLERKATKKEKTTVKVTKLTGYLDGGRAVYLPSIIKNKKCPVCGGRAFLIIDEEKSEPVYDLACKYSSCYRITGIAKGIVMKEFDKSGTIYKVDKHGNKKPDKKLLQKRELQALPTKPEPVPPLQSLDSRRSLEKDKKKNKKLGTAKRKHSK